MSNIGMEMAIDHAIMDVDAMTNEQVLRYVDKKAVSSMEMTMSDYRAKAEELKLQEYLERTE